MFNSTVIKEKFMGLVGLRQNDNPAFPQLSSHLVYNNSNVLVEDPLLNIENIDMCVRNYGKYQYATWSALTTYSVGEKIKYNDVVYRSLVNPNLNNIPGIVTSAWEEVNLLSAFLEDVFGSAIEDTINQMFVAKKLNANSKTLLQSVKFSSISGNATDTIVKAGDLVGVEISLRHRNNIVAIVEKIGMQLTAVNSGENKIKFYVYHDSMVAPIFVAEKDHTKIISYQWHEVNFGLNYLSDDFDNSGNFYILYDENDLVGQAIERRYSFDAVPCTCNPCDYQNWTSYNGYLSIRAVRLKAIYRDVDEPTWIYNFSKLEYTPNTNFGMNFQVTVRCDLTNFLVAQKDLFKYAVRDMVKKKMLEHLSNSTRQNGTQEKVGVMALNRLMAKYAGGLGFVEEVNKQIAAVGFEIADLDNTCMPCATKKFGFKTGVAGYDV